MKSLVWERGWLQMNLPTPSAVTDTSSKSATILKLDDLSWLRHLVKTFQFLREKNAAISSDVTRGIKLKTNWSAMFILNIISLLQLNLHAKRCQLSTSCFQTLTRSKLSALSTQQGHATHHKSMRQQSTPKIQWTRATNRLKTSRTG